MLSNQYTLMVCGSPQGSSPELLGRLALNAGQIIAVDSGADWLVAAGLMPDLLVGDLDSINASILATIQSSKCQFVTVPAHKDFTDFDLALEEFAKSQNSAEPSRLIITNLLGGRLDHELGALGSLARFRGSCLAGSQQNVPIVEDTCQATILIGEASLALNTMASVGSTVSIIPLFSEAVVSASGLEWELDHATLPALSSQGVSNVVNSKTAQITIHQGVALVQAQ
jgi:thiamine pyrophosphokinase